MNQQVGGPQSRRELRLIRPRVALKAIKQYSDDMAEQERQNAKFHTLFAVDSDVLHMAAFPVENLAQGSMFHAWEPLRKLAARMAATMDGAQGADHNLRFSLLDEIFDKDESRVPLLTTIALSTYIFERRGLPRPFSCYALLPPHEPEWERAVFRARQRAARWAHDLAKHVDVQKVREVVLQARSRGDSHLAETLVDALPHVASALFPLQLSPDFAVSNLIGWKMSGTIRSFDKIPGLQAFESMMSRQSVENFETLLRKDLRDSNALRGSTPAERVKREAQMARAIEGDARVLALLEAVASKGFEVRPAGSERSLPLRVILVSASARLWRVARLAGLASACLRSPLAYLSEGRFFKWAIPGHHVSGGEQIALLQRLYDGLLSDWLTPLTASSGAEPDAVVDVAHMECVSQWERLMSHLATSLNIASPLTGLRKAIQDSLGDAQLDAGSLAALLQHKIMYATNKLAQSASEVGLAQVDIADVAPCRPAPPVRFTRYEPVYALLYETAFGSLDSDAARLSLLERLMSLRLVSVDPQSGRNASSYFRSVLLSILWFRLGQWDVARDVAEHAAAFGLVQRPDADAPVSDVEASEPWFDGEEALYLVALTARESARDTQSLALATLALDAIASQSADRKPDLRFAAERQAIQVAEILLADVPARGAGLAALVMLKVNGALESAREIMKSPEWSAGNAVFDPPKEGGVVAINDYAVRYATMELRCSTGLLWLFALAGHPEPNRKVLPSMDPVPTVDCLCRDPGESTSSAAALPESDLAALVRAYLSHIDGGRRIPSEAGAENESRQRRAGDLRHAAHELIRKPFRSPYELRCLEWLANTPLPGLAA